MRDCDICMGRGTVRLPVYERLSVTELDGSVPGGMEERSREFPCPQCAEVVSFQRMAVVTAMADIDTRGQRIHGDAYVKSVQRGAAVKLADYMLTQGLISFELRPDASRDTIKLMQATVGVVAPRDVATLERRVALRQMEVAEQVVDATIEEIRNWGSYYHGREAGSVGKSQAIEWLRTALKKVREYRNATRRE